MGNRLRSRFTRSRRRATEPDETDSLHPARGYLVAADIAREFPHVDAAAAQRAEFLRRWRDGPTLILERSSALVLRAAGPDETALRCPHCDMPVILEDVDG